MPTDVHEYRAELRWSGSTAGGYRGYDRAHTVALPPGATRLTLSSDPAFRGDPALANPEQLLTAAASSCQMLSFLALAARAGVEVVSYTDDAKGFMPMRTASIERIELRPLIRVRPPADRSVVLDLARRAHEDCFIARSLKTHVLVQAEVAVVAPGDPEPSTTD
jgi:organic hydroperoxide reductase OsmC/OhrA